MEKARKRDSRAQQRTAATAAEPEEAATRRRLCALDRLGRLGAKALTFFGNDRQGDGDTGILDQLHDVVVGQVDDGLPVHGGDEVSDLELPTAVGGAPVYDSADFMRNDCEKNIPRFFNCLRNLLVLDLSSSLFKNFIQHHRKAFKI